MKTKLNPLDNRVIVVPIEAEEKTPGGIVLPDAAQRKPNRGKVVAVGPGLMLDSGYRVAPALCIGDEVIYSQHGGSAIEVDGEPCMVLRESDILAVVG